MKKYIRLLFVLALIGAGFGTRAASASTILVDPSPTDSFHVGGFTPPNTTSDDVYTFTLTRPAVFSTAITLAATSSGWYSLLDNGVPHLSSLLAANTTYVLHLFLSAGFTDVGFYGGTVDFTAVATTPLPPAILMFFTAIAGLTGLAWRRGKPSV